jgi:hypothetical protein
MQNEKELMRLRPASCLRRELPAEPGARNFACSFARARFPPREANINFTCAARTTFHQGGSNLSDFACGANYPPAPV